MKKPVCKSAVLPATVLLLGATLLGQQPDIPPPERGAIEGTVINTQTGRVVPRATVVIRSLSKTQEARSVRADGAGHFLFKGLAPGSYRLNAQRPGFFSGTRHQVFQYRVDVAEGDHRVNIVLRLTPAAVVSGQILDENSDPLRSVQLQLMERIFSNGRILLEQVQEAMTDDQGRYRLFDVRPGAYYLMAQVFPEVEGKLQVAGDAAMIHAPPESDIAYSPAFYPETTDFREAHALTIAPGDETHANFIFYARPSVAIFGKVINGITGDPARNAAIVARWTEYLEYNQYSAKNSPADGGFEIRGLAPGTYTLHASFSEDGIQYSAQRTVEVGPHGIENVVLTGLPDTPVAGSISLEHAVIQPYAMRRVAVTFQSNDSPAAAHANATIPTLDFATRLHPGDSYTGSVQNLPGDYYLKNIRIAGHTVEQNQVVVGDVDAEIELTLSPQGGHIHGLVLDDTGQPISAPVVLIPEVSRRDIPDLFRKVTSDKQGWFTLRGIPPGAYQLLAFDEVDLGELIGQPEILQQFADRAVTVTVQEKGNYMPALKVIRTAE